MLPVKLIWAFARDRSLCSPERGETLAPLVCADILLADTTEKGDKDGVFASAIRLFVLAVCNHAARSAALRHRDCDSRSGCHRSHYLEVQRGRGLGDRRAYRGPLVFLLVVIFIRVQLEIIIVIFRIAEYLRDMAGERRVE